MVRFIIDQTLLKRKTAFVPTFRVNFFSNLIQVDQRKKLTLIYFLITFHRSLYLRILLFFFKEDFYMKKNQWNPQIFQELRFLSFWHISNSGLTITASRIEHVRSRIKVRITRHVAHHFHSAIPVSRCSHHDQSGVTAQMH